MRSHDHGLSRRGFLAGSGAVLGGALLAACSSGGSTGATGAAQPAKGFPVTVGGKVAPVTVRTTPRRVVSVGYLRDTDLALALDAHLVGAAKSGNFPSGLGPWQHVGSDVTLFDRTNGLPFEKVAALRPDLILASDDYDLAKDQKNLSAIAPTLGYRNGVGQDTWQTMLLRAGQVLGRSDEARKKIEAVEATVAKARERYAVLAGKTFTFGPVLPNNSVYTTSRSTDAAVPFFAQLGMKLAPAVTELKESATAGKSQVSAENLGVLDADVVILSYTSSELRKRFESSPVFRRLPAVRRGAYVPLDVSDAVALAFPSALSIPYGVERVAPKLAAAAAKR